MALALEKLEKCIERAIAEAHQFAEHNDSDTVLPEHLKAAMLKQAPSEEPDSDISEKLGLTTVLRAAPPKLETACQCQVCAGMCSVEQPLRVSAESNQLTVALPFQ